MEEVTTEWVKREFIKCSFSASYFINTYVQIYDATTATWIPFELWPEQESTLQTITDERLVIILKARQLGQTWLCLAYILHKMIFKPIQTALLFSRREDESIYLLRKRLKRMHGRLPEWMQSPTFLTDSQHEWQLENESIAYAFPTTAGDSYTASIVLVDEADLIPDLGALMTSVKPTIDGGGEMILLSRSNKDLPRSPFKQYYRAAKKGNNWAYVFLPWDARPSRNRGWYLEQKLDILSRTGSLDDLWEQYPASDVEALAPKQQAKRIPPKHVEQCFEELEPLVKSQLEDCPAITELEVFFEPQLELTYVIGADPAEGNPKSDESSFTVLEEITQEEVATFSAKVETDVFSDYIERVATWYNNASVLVERNNHGHVVIKDLIGAVELLNGEDGKPGWQTNAKSKSAMYNIAAEQFRDKQVVIHSQETAHQVMSVEGATLKAPKGENDDRAMGFVLAIQALHLPKTIVVVRNYASPRRITRDVYRQSIRRRAPRHIQYS